MKNIITLLSKTSGSSAIVPLRFILGAIFIGHGAQKLLGWFGGYGLQATAGFFQEQLGLSPGILWAFLASAGELVGGLLLLVGFLARFQGALLSFAMVVAILTAHNSAFFLPAGMEYTLALLGGSLVFAIGGAGKASIDYNLTNRN
ncbi:MAG: DoxX family protein [Opitutales bacterium]|jgi:putative oxidoreductase|nr:DoxX family protein [Opitutales bacterium]